MALSGTLRKRLSKREGEKNSNLPGRMGSMDSGPGDPKMTGVHGGGHDTNMKFGNAGADCKMTGCHQAQGKDPNIGNEKFDRDFRTQVKGHGGHGPNPCGSKRR